MVRMEVYDSKPLMKFRLEIKAPETMLTIEPPAGMTAAERTELADALRTAAGLLTGVTLIWNGPNGETHP